MEHLDDMNICTDETVPTGVAPPTHSGNDRVPPVASEDTRIGSVESYEASFIKEEPTEDGVAGDTVSFQPTMEVLSEPRLSPKCLRKIRKPITMAFDPSQCPQCGTGNMCNRCRINKEKKKTQKAIQARMQALSSAKAVGVMESKQPKKRLEVGKKIPGKHMITSRRNDLNKNKDKKGSLVGQGVVRKPLTGAAASSHAKRLDRERAEKENNVNDFSKSSKMFSFIEHFLASCPQDRIDSLVALSPGEALMTCVGNMTYRQLAQHLYGLRVEHVQRIMRPILFRLMTHPKNFDLFNAPVDPDALGIPSYFQIIKRPMDLGTVKSVLQRGGFQTLESCIKDIDLVFDNAMLFNPVNHVVHDSAKLLQSEFHSEISTLKEKLQREVRMTAMPIIAVGRYVTNSVVFFVGGAEIPSCLFLVSGIQLLPMWRKVFKSRNSHTCMSWPMWAENQKKWYIFRVERWSHVMVPEMPHGPSCGCVRAFGAWSTTYNEKRPFKKTFR